MNLKVALLGSFVFALAACSQPEPEPVYVQPTYDKVGNPSCPGGYQVAATEAGATVCSPITQ
ncbi:hypothetical protein [Ruegeria hyattellae]|jgi:hypothetical protein|uniref:hypothetical protein n=1 Tax=Ruegeria hyattellae TaxID=3233337 RepID=UPI00355C8908